MATIQILCGCGWGDLCYSIEHGDEPTCPLCGHVFPTFIEGYYGDEED